MKSKLYLGVALACSAAAAILPVHGYAAEAEETAAAESKTAQEEKAAPEAAPVDLNTYAVEGVVVTASRMPQAISDVPANVSVITAQEIEDNHYNTVSEALQNVNGVVVEGRGIGEQDIVKLNGDDRVLVLVDGRRINSDQGLGANRGTADLRMIPSMKNIERIEIVKGGASALYGSDAVGGVINVITKKGAKDMKTTIDTAYGSWHKGEYQITNEGSVKDFSWMITGNITHQDYFKSKDSKGTVHKVEPGKSNEKNFSLRLDQKMGKRESISLGYTHVNSETGNYAYNAGNFVDYGGRVKRIRNSVDLNWNFKEGTKAPGFLRVYHEKKSNLFNTSFDYKTDGIEYQNGWELGKDHVLIAGLDWRQTKSTNEANGYRDKKNENTAIYIQDTWKISKKLSLVPGLRVDHHNKFGTHWSPKVAINYTPDKKNQVYASWGHVFNAPQADDLYYNSPFPGGPYGNEDLEPEKGYTATIGWNHEFNDSASLSVSAFQSKIKNAIYWRYDDAFNMRAKNMDQEKKRGIELEYKQKLNKHWSFDAGMSFIHAERRLEWDWYGTNEYASFNAPNSYRIGMNYRNRGWFIGLNTTAVSGRNESSFGNKHYALVNLNASYQFNETFKVYLKGLNLTNQYYTIGSSAGFPGYGRFIQMGVQVSF